MGNTKADIFGGSGGAAGSIVVGNPVTGGGANRVLYENGSQALAASANLTYDGTNVTLNGAFIASNSGSVSNVAFATVDVNTGLYRASGSQLGIVAGGVEVARVFSTVFSLGTLPVVFGTGVSTSDVGIIRAAAGVIKVGAATGAGSGWLQQPAGELTLNANYTNATAAFTNTALITPVNLVSGRTYAFTAALFFSDSTAADGAQFDFNAGSATSTNFIAHANAFNNAGAALVITNGASTALATAIQVTLALTTQACITIQGSFVPSSNGTFGIRAAQTAHSTGTLTVNRGSWLNIRDSNPL